MRKTIFTFILCLMAGLALQAQEKYGHLNFGNVVALMPETAQADASLEAYRKELVAKGEGMVNSFKEKYGQLVADEQSGTYTPKALQERAQVLAKEEQDILAYEQEVREKVEQKRQELLKPIIQKAENAIKDIAKANGYVMIFDTSVFNAVLFAQDTDDVFPLIKSKLGLKEPTGGK